MMISVVRDAFFRLIGIQIAFSMKTPNTMVASIATRKADARYIPEVFANSAMYAANAAKSPCAKFTKLSVLLMIGVQGLANPGICNP